MHLLLALMEIELIMNLTNCLISCLQYFSRDYTNNYLQSRLPIAGSDIKIYYNNNEKMAEVRMKVGAKKTAIMTGEWMSVTKDQEWRVGDIIVFWFQYHGENSLQVRVEIF